MRQCKLLSFVASTLFLLLFSVNAQAQSVGINPDDMAFNFGTVAVGSTSAPGVASVHQTNVFGADVTVSSVTLSDSVNYSMQDECTGVTLSSPLADLTESFCRVSVVFHPTAGGAIPTATLTIASNAGGNPHIINLDGTGVVAEIDVVLAPPTFPATLVGQTATATATVTNNGTVALDIGAIDIVGGDFTNFTVVADNCSNTQVAAVGGTCTFDVEFTPDAVATFDANVHVPNSDPAAPNFLLFVTGDGAANPALTVKPDSLQLDFPNTGVGSTSQALILEVHNTGTTPLENINLTTPVIPEYAYLQDHCTGSTLATGESCLVQITFSPSDDLTYIELITISADDVSDVDVTLEGTGVFGPALQILPSSLTLSFPDTGVGQTSEVLTLELHSTGTTTVENVTVPAPAIADFVKIQDNCSGENLAPGQSCLARFTFAPSAALNFVEILTITSDNLGDQDVTLDGDGIVGPAINLSSTALTFGSLFVGSADTPQLVQVTNSGTTPLAITSVTNAGPDFFLNSDTCSGQTIVAGGSCLLQVVFLPTVSGNPLTDTFTITSDAVSGPSAFTTSGVGLQSALSASGSGSFGNVNVGSQGGPNTITITNTDVDANLIIGSLSRIGDDTTQFSIQNDTCSNQTVAPGDDCTFQAVFSPTAGGAFTDVVLIPNNSATPSFTFNLSGTGIVPVPPGVGLLQIKTDVLDFDLETSSSDSQSTTVTNIGDGPVTINALAIEGDSEFSQVNDCEGQTLAPGAFCSITVTFSAGGASGNFNAVVTIDSNPETSAFLVLLGSSLNDEVGGGGCSISAGANVLSASWLWMGLVPAFAVGILRRRVR